MRFGSHLPFLRLCFIGTSLQAVGKKTDAMEPALLVRPATPTFAGWWVPRNAGFWGEAWPPPRPLLPWTGLEAGVRPHGTVRRAWRRPAELKLSTGPGIPREDSRGRETETTRRLCKQALSSPWLCGRRAGVSVCTLDTARHPPLSAGQIGCIAKLVPLLSGPLKQIQANWKAAAPAATARPHNHPKFRPEKNWVTTFTEESILFLRVLTFP